ncbi:MAG: hypothetical protein DME23_14950 [Verrucomicrobia bacterium]|nr:MAG: hypothetical protein DME23_14950 [Verrucomicrobiota bacterium]
MAGIPLWTMPLILMTIADKIFRFPSFFVAPTRFRHFDFANVGAVAEFVHHQRWLRSAVDEDFYLPPSSLFRHSHRSASIGSIVPLISGRMANLRSFIDNS